LDNDACVEEAPRPNPLELVPTAAQLATGTRGGGTRHGVDLKGKAMCPHHNRLTTKRLVINDNQAQRANLLEFFGRGNVSRPIEKRRQIVPRLNVARALPVDIHTI
jgi:hypothetical protein